MILFQLRRGIEFVSMFLLHYLIDMTHMPSTIVWISYSKIHVSQSILILPCTSYRSVLIVLTLIYPKQNTIECHIFITCVARISKCRWLHGPAELFYCPYVERKDHLFCDKSVRDGDRRSGGFNQRVVWRQTSLQNSILPNGRGEAAYLNIRSVPAAR